MERKKCIDEGCFSVGRWKDLFKEKKETPFYFHLKLNVKINTKKHLKQDMKSCNALGNKSVDFFCHFCQSSSRKKKEIVKNIFNMHSFSWHTAHKSFSRQSIDKLLEKCFPVKRIMAFFREVNKKKGFFFSSFPKNYELLKKSLKNEMLMQNRNGKSVSKKPIKFIKIISIFMC